MPATQLLWHTQPAATLASGSTDTALVVYVADGSGAPVSGNADRVSLELIAVSGAGTPFGALTAQATNGVATWNNFTSYRPGVGLVSMAGGTFKWRARHLTLGTLDSATFTVPADTHPAYAGTLTVDQVLSPMLSSPQMAAAGYGFYDSQFDAFNDFHWEREFGSGATAPLNEKIDGNYYDGALADYARAKRCEASDPARAAVMYARADQQIKIYRDGYLDPTDNGWRGILPTNGGVQPHETFAKGITIHYLRTGDYASKLAIELMGFDLWNQVARVIVRDQAIMGINDMSDTRPLVRAIQGFMYAGLLGCADGGVAWSLGTDLGVAPPPWSNVREYLLQLTLAFQNANGSWPVSAYCGGQANFQAGIVNDVLIEYKQLVDIQDVTDSIARSATYLAGQWSSADQSFWYLNTPCQAAFGTPPYNGFAGDLSGLIVNGLAWSVARAGREDLRALVAEILSVMVETDSVPFGQLASHKQFNQLYSVSYKAHALLAEGAVDTSPRLRGRRYRR
jgi:hypothetical protein